MRTARPLLAAVVLLSLPAQALADCTYTGAKRAYLECIYNEAAAATSGLLDSAAAIAGLDTRVGELEGDVGTLEADVGTLEVSVSALDAEADSLVAGQAGLSGALDVLSAALADLSAWVTGIDGDLGLLESDVAQLDADVTSLDAQVTSLDAEVNTLSSASALPLHSAARPYMVMTTNSYAIDGNGDGFADLATRGACSDDPAIPAGGGYVACTASQATTLQKLLLPNAPGDLFYWTAPNLGAINTGEMWTLPSRYLVRSCCNSPTNTPGSFTCPAGRSLASFSSPNWVPWIECMPSNVPQRVLCCRNQ